MPFKRDSDRRLLRFAQEMRRDPTDAEKKLWHLLRRKQLAGFKFRRQVPVAGYILDFYCLNAGLAVEADGGQHLDKPSKRYDTRRAEILAARGVRVLRFPDDVVLKDPDVVAQAIYAALVPEEPSPQPPPGVPGGGEIAAIVRPPPGTPGGGWGEGSAWDE